MTDDERKARRAAALKRYYEKNREKILAKNRQWHHDNPERSRENNLRWLAENPERARELRRKSDTKLRSKRAAKRVLWRKQRREEIASYNRWYQRRGKGSGSDRDPKE